MGIRRGLVALCTVVFAGSLAAPAPAAPILGGQAASEEYPFMVSVQRPDTGNHFCGASLVAKKVVLTAAHCAVDEKPEDLQVMLGSHALDDPGTIIPVKKVEVHPTYEVDGTHDIALLYLKKPAKFAPVAIAAAEQSDLWAPGTPATVIGWGAEIFFVGPGSNDLKEVVVPVVSDEDCASSYGIAGGFEGDNMVCAGEQTGLKDSCQGDSGGPLMVEDGKEWIQFGVVSWGLGCGFPTFYGVYAEVGGDALRDWVLDRL